MGLSNKIKELFEKLDKQALRGYLCGELKTLEEWQLNPLSLYTRKYLGLEELKEHPHNLLERIAYRIGYYMGRTN